MRLIDADKLLTEFKERAEAAEKWQEIAKAEFPTVDKLVKNSINDVLDNPREVSAEEQKCNHLNCPRQFDKVEKDCDINGCPYRTTGITLSALISRQAAIDFIKDHSYLVRYDGNSIELLSGEYFLHMNDEEYFTIIALAPEEGETE